MQQLASLFPDFEPSLQWLRYPQLIANRLLIIDKGKKMVEGAAAELFDPTETLIELETLDNEKTFAALKQS